MVKMYTKAMQMLFSFLYYLKGYFGCLDSLEGYVGSLFFGFGHFL